MDNLAAKGNSINCGDAAAGLTVVRALVKTLHGKNVIDAKDIDSIVSDAVVQIGSFSNLKDGSPKTCATT